MRRGRPSVDRSFDDLAQLLRTIRDPRQDRRHEDAGGMPASESVRIASIRARGLGVPGSVLRHTSSSRMPIENATETGATSAARWRRSTSRRIKVPFVRIENELR